MVGNINTENLMNQNIGRKIRNGKKTHPKDAGLSMSGFLSSTPLLSPQSTFIVLKKNETKNKQSLQRPLVTYRYREMKIERVMGREPVLVAVDLWE